MPGSAVLTIGFTFAASVLLALAMRRLAIRFRVLDIPSDPRKHHAKATPLLGGVAVILAFALGVAVAWPQLTGGYLLPKQLAGVLLGGGILLLGGALDDRFNLKPLQQIFFPVAASLVIVAAGIGVPYISNPFGGVLSLEQWEWTAFTLGELPYQVTLLADLFTVVWLLGTMYTTKFLDGLDGLVSGVTVIGTVVIAILSLTAVVYQPETALLSLLAGAAFLGFLLLNWHPAKMFLGESGALFAGFILGVLAIISGGKIATALLILGIPILDVAWVIVRRLFLEKRSPFAADRKHLHLRLIDAGLSPRQAVLLLYALTAGFGLSSLFLQSRAKVVALIAVGAAMLLLGSIVVWQYRKRGGQPA